MVLERIEAALASGLLGAGERVCVDSTAGGAAHRLTLCRLLVVECQRANYRGIRSQ